MQNRPAPFPPESSANPFREEVFVDRPANLPGVGAIHEEAFDLVAEALGELQGERADPTGFGRLFLVRAAEAGAGKSHLVARIRDHFATTVPTFLLPFDPSRPTSWPVVLSSGLRQFSAPSELPGPGATAAPSTSLLDGFSSRFLARLVMEALWAGSLRARECPEDIARLAAEPTLLFSPESDSGMLDWLDRHAAELAASPGMGLPRRLGMGGGEVSFWARLFIDRSRRVEGALDRLRGLSNGEARERLLQLLRLATDDRAMLVVADHLDGFHRSETAGMEIAEILNGIRERVSRSVVLLCANDDLWASVFAERLPSAWRDRLDGETLVLPPLEPTLARDLVKWRLHRLALEEPAAAHFAARLAEKNHWSEGLPLSPRRALRQASALWTREGRRILEAPLPPAADPIPPLAVDDESAPPPRHRALDEASTPSRGHSAGLAPEGFTGERGAPLPIGSPEEDDAEILVAIESIIDDIRGSGKTVVSEAPGSRFGEETGSLEIQEAATGWTAPSQPPSAASEGRSSDRSSDLAPTLAPPLPRGFTPPTAPAVKAPPSPSPSLSARAAITRSLAEHEQALLSGGALLLDLDRVARFVRRVGSSHPALAQEEEHHPSSRSTCLRWRVRGHSVLTGFESPRNVSFWNQLLQRSLASNHLEKIAAFSHSSEPFDPALFSSFGFSPSVVRARVDIIEMNDRELAMIYASDQTLSDCPGSPEADLALQLVALHLDPLWRRIVRPL